MTKPTDVTAFIDELDAGVFSEKVAHALSQMALAVCEHGRDGSLQLTFKVKRLGNGSQVNVAHRMLSTRPTLRGKVSEEDTTETPMHVGAGGAMTIFPENQMDLIPNSGKAGVSA